MNQADEAPGRDVRPLFSIEAEQAVLGSLMLDNAAFDRIVGLCDLDDFYTDDSRALFRTISGLISQRRQADVITVADALRSAGDLERVGGLPYLQELVASTPSAANVKRYAEIVRDRAMLRHVLSASGRMADLAREANGYTGRDVLDQAHRMLVEIEAGAAHGRGELRPIADSVTPALEQLDEAQRAHKEGKTSGVESGFSRLDFRTGGMGPGQLIVVAGRPGMGKSAIALNIVRHNAVTRKKASAYFSMEMSREELTTLLLADLGNLHGIRASHGRISDSEWHALGVAGAAISGAPIYLNDTAALTITEITASSRRLARELSTPLSMIVIDYLGLMRTERQTSNRAQDMAEISRGLKSLAKELRIPVILLAQLNRECEKRGDKRPVLSDLRDSGEIEADADMVWMLYRDELYYPDRDDNAGKAELIIRKQRNGPIGAVALRYDGARTRFSDPEDSP